MSNLHLLFAGTNLKFVLAEPGKARPGVGAFFGFGHEAIHVKQYEVLVGDSRGTRWVPASGTFSFDRLGAHPVEGGREDDGTPLVIARGHAKERSGVLGIGGGGQEGLFPGKASPKLNGAYVTAGDKEVKVEVRFHSTFHLCLAHVSFLVNLPLQDYEVLCFA